MTNSAIELDPKLNTNQITPELIDYIVQKIVDRFNPYQIILFGSQARGDAAPDSDLDLFIVQSGSGSNRQLRRELDMFLAGRHFPLDLIVRKPQEIELNLEDKNPFYIYHLFGEGKVLYEQARETA
ncbi:MAG TPA: nucleotidyltransferase domain-containing protein [Chloroflexi bacterium]|nr:nucleotidyltransferase domain-containing protein [Chloroflexota bacterium]